MMNVCADEYNAYACTEWLCRFRSALNVCWYVNRFNKLTYWWDNSKRFSIQSKWLHSEVHQIDLNLFIPIIFLCVDCAITSLSSQMKHQRILEGDKNLFISLSFKSIDIEVSNSDAALGWSKNSMQEYSQFKVSTFLLPSFVYFSK